MANIPKQTVIANDVEVAPLLSDPSLTSHWAFINGWKVEPQSDDRAQVVGTVAPSTAAPGARRSAARREHQAMFREWSQDRHD